ncbi:MAG: MerR family transcriptional regulator [Acidobacteria bacterium]|nr:MerR family transcriptional regulator [Acidobacteriota bacterium]
MTPKLYKAGEVCEAAGLQPYVLRSWEKEFPGIGVQRSPDSPRLYRQSDLDQVLRIKQLVFGEGLTLAGARRRIDETSPKPTEDDEAEMAEVIETLGADARARIAMVRHGLRSLLEVLSKVPGTAEFEEFNLSPPATPGNARTADKVSSSRTSAASRTGRDRKAAPKAKIIAKRTAPKPQASAKRKRASA